MPKKLKVSWYANTRKDIPNYVVAVGSIFITHVVGIVNSKHLNIATTML